MWKPHLVWFGGTIDQRPDFPPQSENLSSCCSPIKAWSGQELQMWGGGEAPGRRMMEVEEHRRLSYHIRAFLMPVLTLNLKYDFRKTSVPQKNFSRSSYLFDDVECMGRNSQNGSPSRKRGRSCLGAIFNFFPFFHQNQLPVGGSNGQTLPNCHCNPPERKND